MVQVRFYALDMRRAELEDKQVVLIFGRTEDNQRICVIDSTFQPFFYVIPKNPEVKEKLEKLEIENDGRISKVLKTELVEKNILGNKINAIKVTVPFQKDIKVIKKVIDEWEIIENIYEDDIPYLRRYLNEKNYTMSTLYEVTGNETNAGFKVNTILAEKLLQIPEKQVSKLKILAFDIETYNPEGSKIDMKENPIVMISFYGEDFQKVISWKRFPTTLDVDFVNSEMELIEKFIEIVENYQPDMIAGYNSDQFDFPYIAERAKKYKLSLNLGLDNKKIAFAKGENKRARIPGIIHADLYRFIKRTFSISGGYTLNNVSKKLINHEKKDIDISKLAAAWDSEQNLAEYAEYNLIDSELVYKLAKKLLHNILEFAKIAGMLVDNIMRLYYSNIVESFLVRKSNEMNELVPNRPSKSQIATRFLDTYKGSFVYEPKPGIYNKIAVFDFRSLYPTIIASHNISPETINCSCCQKTNIPSDSKEEYHFCEKNKGFLPSILEEIINLRKSLKDNPDEFTNAKSESLKLLANSFYGYLGYYGSRWYSIDSAKAITEWGRHYIHKIINLAKEEGYEVIYSDTDSIFLELKDQEDSIQEFLAKANHSLPDIMELEYEGTFNRGIFVGAKESSKGAKKKYALLAKDGSLQIKGFESIKSNYSNISKDVQQKVLELVLKTGTIEEAFDFVKDCIKKLRNKEIPNKETIISTTITKHVEEYDTIGPHVAVAKKMKENGLPVHPGSKIKYIISNKDGTIAEKATIPADVLEGNYDADYYINNQLIPSIEKIFELFRYTREDLEENKGQKKLGEF